MKTRVLALVSAIAALTATAAAAHHSFAMYDREKTLTVSGIVKEFTWAAPHVMIEVLSGNDMPVRWAIEGSSPTVLARGGWTASLMRPGDRISVGLHPRKDGGAGGLLADEQQLLLNGRPPKGVLWLRPSADETGER